MLKEYNYMKRFAITAFLALAIGAGSLFADHPGGWGVGLQGGWSGGGGGGISVKAPQLPIYWTVNVSSGWLGVSGDYYFIDSPLVGSLGWYLGAGGFVNIIYNTEYSLYRRSYWLGVGAEIPIGLSWLPLDFLEVYIQAVPFVGLGIGGGGLGVWPGVGASLGVRVWF